MIKLILLSALCSMALAGYASLGHGYGHAVGGHGHGHGGYGHGVNHGHAGYGHGHGHGYRRPYHGWANVNVWQNPHAYQYGLNEQGSGYNKFIWQGADFHHAQPVKYGGY